MGVFDFLKKSSENNDDFYDYNVLVGKTKEFIKQEAKRISSKSVKRSLHRTLRILELRELEFHVAELKLEMAMIGSLDPAYKKLSRKVTSGLAQIETVKEKIIKDQKESLSEKSKITSITLNFIKTELIKEEPDLTAFTEELRKFDRLLRNQAWMDVAEGMLIKGEKGKFTKCLVEALYNYPSKSSPVWELIYDNNTEGAQLIPQDAPKTMDTVVNLRTKLGSIQDARIASGEDNEVPVVNDGAETSRIDESIKSLGANEGIEEEIISIKEGFSELSRRHQRQATIVGPGAGQGPETISIICSVCDDVIKALSEGVDSEGLPINTTQVADGLKRLVGDARSDTGVIAVQLNSEGVALYGEYLNRLDRIADTIRGE